MGPEQQIEEYIRANRGQYERNAITDQLISAGFDPAAVEAAWERLGVPAVASGTRTIDPKIADYINANRRRYTDQAIRQQLIDAGHSPADIEATWSALDVPDPDATIGPRFWRYFWIWVGVTYVLAFVVVMLPTGMLTGAASGLAVIYALVLAVALVISWAVVAAVRPTRMSPALALAIGAIVPLLFLLIVAGSCYALVAGVGTPAGPAGPPPVNGVMELEIDPPLEFSGSGPAFCQSHGVPGGLSVFSEQLGTIDGQSVNASFDVSGASTDPNAPAPAPGTESYVSINLFPTSGSGTQVGYSPGPGSQVEVDAAPDGLSGSVEFEGLVPMAFEERGPAVTDAEPISGRMTWNCE